MLRVGLTQKQETFCLRYFETGNATESAKLAGYSSRTATAIACENLTKPYILARVEELRQKAEDDSVAGVLERKQRLTEIARADIPDYVSEDGIKVDKSSPNTGAVSELTTRMRMFKKTGEPVVITNLKLHNPIQAIAELNKMERVYEPEGTVTIHNTKTTIIVASEEGKRNLERIMDGERT